MKKKEKLIVNLNFIPTPIFFIIFLLIITLGLPSPVYANSNEKVENKNNSRSWENNGPNRDMPNKLIVRTGKVMRHAPPPHDPIIIPDPPHKKPRPPKERPPDEGDWCPPGYIVPMPGDENEEELEPQEPGDTLTPDDSIGLPKKEYHINDSFTLEPLLARKIDEYNAKHLNQDSLEYPRSQWGAFLTYQVLESLDLIEHMETKIQYYQQQLDAVRNSNLSPAEKSPKELFWLERIERLQKSKQKEEERVSDLRSQIAEERRKLV